MVRKKRRGDKKITMKKWFKAHKKENKYAKRYAKTGYKRDRKLYLKAGRREDKLFKQIKR